VIDERGLPAADTPSGGEAMALRSPKNESIRDKDAGGGLSDTMRRYIVGYGGPVTAESTNPFGLAT
jgi:hypothetical protein